MYLLEVVDKYVFLGLDVNKEGIGGEKQRKGKESGRNYYE